MRVPRRSPRSRMLSTISIRRWQKSLNAVSDKEQDIKKESGNMKRRVVVTGLGIVTPLGIGVDKNWEAVCAGKSGIGPITRFDASDFSCRIAGEVKDFRPEDFMDNQMVRRFDIFIHYGIASARMAMEDSGLKIDSGSSQRVGCITGCGLGGLTMIEHFHKLYLEKGPRRISPFFIPGIDR